MGCQSYFEKAARTQGYWQWLVARDHPCRPDPNRSRVKVGRVGLEMGWVETGVVEMGWAVRA